MEILHGARLARFDLLCPICALARMVTRWDVTCDAKLHRLGCDINSLLHLKVVGWVGDALNDPLTCVQMQTLRATE